MEATEGESKDLSTEIIDASGVSTGSQAGEVVFPERVVIEACSWNKCGRGHTWPVAVGVAKCGGCGSPVLAVKMENCPICNEPATATRIRTDYLPAGGPIALVCRGQKHPMVVTEAIEIERTHAEETEKQAKSD